MSPAPPTPATSVRTAAQREPTVWLTHNRVRLAVHRLRPGRADGARPLLLLHGLGEHSPGAVPPHLDGWPGAVWALDFTGHGASTVPVGGGYTAEILMADVDAVLAEIGPATLHGRGLGAYVALLAAGARPSLVRGAVLDDGPGLAGGGPAPGSPSPFPPDAPLGEVPDPFALVELARDIRPADYALTYLRQAVQLSGLDEPIAVAAVVRPPWLAAVADEPGARATGAPAALAHFAEG